MYEVYVYSSVYQVILFNPNQRSVRMSRDHIVTSELLSGSIYNNKFIYIKRSGFLQQIIAGIKLS